MVDFVCPKCGGVLNISDNNVKKCGQNHCYDRSRRGYYNLLLGTGGIHGDNSEMVDARRRFLSYGHYDRLRRAICDTVLGVMPENGVLLDVKRSSGNDPLHLVAYSAKRLGKNKTATFLTESTSHLFKGVAGSATSTLEIKVTDCFGREYTETMTRPKDFEISNYK